MNNIRTNITNKDNNTFIIDHISKIKTDRIKDWGNDESLEEMRRRVQRKIRKEKLDKLLKEETQKDNKNERRRKK